MCMYYLYYDESFHDHHVSIKEGILNTEVSDSRGFIRGSDFFVTAVVGGNRKYIDKWENKYSIFERFSKNKLKTEYKDDFDETVEFKGTSIRYSQYKHGIASFDNVTSSIYKKLFKSFLNEKYLIFQTTLESKIEFLISYLFQYGTVDLISSDMYPKHRKFQGTLLEIFYRYKTQELLSNIENGERDRIIHRLKQLILDNTVNNKIDGLIDDVETYLEYFDQITQVNAESHYDWDYKYAILGVESILTEDYNIPLSSVVLNIDEEDKTVKAAKEFGFKEVLPFDSEKCTLGRMADFFSNFFGRMLKSIYDEMILKGNEELNKSWFDLNIDQFIIYKELGNFFIDRKNIYYVTQIQANPYIPMTLFNLFSYISEFQTIENYKKISPSEHSMSFNSLNKEVVQAKFVTNDPRDRMIIKQEDSYQSIPLSKL